MWNGDAQTTHPKKNKPHYPKWIPKFQIYLYQVQTIQWESSLCREKIPHSTLSTTDEWQKLQPFLLKLSPTQLLKCALLDYIAQTMDKRNRCTILCNELPQHRNQSQVQPTHLQAVCPISSLDWILYVGDGWHGQIIRTVRSFWHTTSLWDPHFKQSSQPQLAILWSHSHYLTSDHDPVDKRQIVIVISTASMFIGLAVGLT